MAKFLLTTFALAALSTTTFAQFDPNQFQPGPAVVLPLLQPSQQPQPPFPPINNNPPNNFAPQFIDPFFIGTPVIAAPFQTTPQTVSCNGQLTPCRVAGNWLCIDDTLMICGPDILCPKELPNVCGLASGTRLCYNSSVLQCTNTGELIVIPTENTIADGTANHNAVTTPNFNNNNNNNIPPGAVNPNFVNNNVGIPTNNAAIPINNTVPPINTIQTEPVPPVQPIIITNQPIIQ